MTAGTRGASSAGIDADRHHEARNVERAGFVVMRIRGTAHFMEHIGTVETPVDFSF
jgi:hypothetical protein